MTAPDDTSELINADRVRLPNKPNAAARPAPKTARSPHPYSYADHEPPLTSDGHAQSLSLPSDTSVLSGQVNLYFFLIWNCL